MVAFDHVPAQCGWFLLPTGQAKNFKITVNAANGEFRDTARRTTRVRARALSLALFFHPTVRH